MKNGTYNHNLFVASDQGKRPAYYVFPDGFLQKLNPPYTDAVGETQVTAEEIRAVIAGVVRKETILDRCDALYTRASKRKSCDQPGDRQTASLDDLLKQAHTRLKHA